MSDRIADPVVRALVDEAHMLPDCMARNALLQRAATAAESLGDLQTAWDARCALLTTTSAAIAPQFETVFLSLAWCLAASDRDPERFPPSRILWQYKWVVEVAPEYASMPRGVLERMIDDLEARFVREGWGRRAAIHKRAELYLALNEQQRAFELLPVWKATPRDAGADCLACEASDMAELMLLGGEMKRAVQTVRPILQGRLSCATVPHRTYGFLLLPFLQLGQRERAADLFDKGRRLISSFFEESAAIAGPYIAFAACVGDVEACTTMLRAQLPRMAALQSDEERMRGFAYAALALQALGSQGVREIELHPIAGLVEEGPTATGRLCDACQKICQEHARALDRRNENCGYADWIRNTTESWMDAQKAAP